MKKLKYRKQHLAISVASSIMDMDWELGFESISNLDNMGKHNGVTGQYKFLR